MTEQMEMTFRPLLSQKPGKRRVGADVAMTPPAPAAQPWRKVRIWRRKGCTPAQVEAALACYAPGKETTTNKVVGGGKYPHGGPTNRATATARMRGSPVYKILENA